MTINNILKKYESYELEKVNLVWTETNGRISRATFPKSQFDNIRKNMTYLDIVDCELLGNETEVDIVIETKRLGDLEFDDDVFEDLQKFSINSNRFLLFDIDGYRLNHYYMKEVNHLENLRVLETRISSFSGYSVGFNTLHIRLGYVLPSDKSHLKDKGIGFGKKVVIPVG
jgi:hypothetical protein